MYHTTIVPLRKSLLYKVKACILFYVSNLRLSSASYTGSCTDRSSLHIFRIEWLASQDDALRNGLVLINGKPAKDRLQLAFVPLPRTTR